MSAYSWPSENGWCHADAAAAAWPETVRSLPVGTPVTGEVVGRQPFGVFLSIEGHPAAIGLARVDRMPWHWELPVVGRSVTGEVLWHHDRLHQVGVALREWVEYAALLRQYVERIGQVVSGRVTRIASSGVFVRLTEGVEGLVPSAGQVAGTPEGVREGLDVSVRIVSVDPQRVRVDLSLDDVAQTTGRQTGAGSGAPEHPQPACSAPQPPPNAASNDALGGS